MLYLTLKKNKMIWKNKPNLELINMSGTNTLVAHLGIEFVELGEDYLIAKMPVDTRTRQPAGLLHGGASAALAETVGSVASLLTLNEIGKQFPVGVELNANHLNSIKSGEVFAKVSPIKIGNRLHVWDIRIYDIDQRPICVSRLTTMIITRK